MKTYFKNIHWLIKLCIIIIDKNLHCTFWSILLQFQGTWSLNYSNKLRVQGWIIQFKSLCTVISAVIRCNSKYHPFHSCLRRTAFCTIPGVKLMLNTQLHLHYFVFPYLIHNICHDCISARNLHLLELLGSIKFLFF